MQTFELVELAALVAQHGPSLPTVTSELGLAGIEAYWAASKCRFDRWGRAMQRLRTADAPHLDVPRHATRGLIEEILGSEVLTRVWTAVVALVDRRRCLNDNDVVARSVYIGHLEMRRRALKLLVGCPGIPSELAVELNHLRRRSELWTDMLLAPLSRAVEVEEFAFELRRLRQFAADLRPDAGRDDDARRARAVMQASLRAAVRQVLAADAPNADLNAQIARAVLAAFPTELFDSHGLFRSLWMQRLAKTADDAQRLLDDMFRSEQLSPPTPDSRRF